MDGFNILILLAHSMIMCIKTLKMCVINVLVQLCFFLTVTSFCFADDKNGVSPNTISLPEGPGSIEGLGEAFQPMLNTGSARYQVKIALPAGINGNTPQLSLQYDSGQGNGPLGIGWTFGPGSISRQTDKGIPRYVDGPNLLDDDHDGQIDETDETDRFVGPDREELVKLADGTYRARIEGSFVRYRRVDSHWEADVKDGSKLIFGNSPDTRLTDQTGAKIYRWLFEKRTDSNGNAIEYHYTGFDESDNQKYLREIRYGPGAGPWETYYFVHLTYDDRPDWTTDYRSGFLVKTSRRLMQIDIGAQGVAPSQCAVGDWNQDGTPDALIRRYVLSYDDTTSHLSLLSKVTRFGSDGITYLPPISFSYSTFKPEPSMSASQAIIGSSNEPNSVMDNSLVELIDLNKDGLPDLLKTDPYGGGHTCYLNLGQSLEGDPAIAWDKKDEMNGADGFASQLSLENDRVHLADMDGNGVSDLIQTTSAGDVYYYLNSGNTGWGRRQWMSIQNTAPPAPFAMENVKTADLDFDKRIDVVKSTENGYAIWFNLKEGTYSREVRTPGATYQDQVILLSEIGVHLADLNGDRMNDVVKVRSNRVIYCANMGHGHFDTAVEMVIPDEALTDGPDLKI